MGADSVVLLENVGATRALIPESSTGRVMLGQIGLKLLANRLHERMAPQVLTRCLASDITEAGRPMDIYNDDTMTVARRDFRGEQISYEIFLGPQTSDRKMFGQYPRVIFIWKANDEGGWKYDACRVAIPGKEIGLNLIARELDQQPPSAEVFLTTQVNLTDAERQLSPLMPQESELEAPTL